MGSTPLPEQYMKKRRRVHLFKRGQTLRCPGCGLVGSMAKVTQHVKKKVSPDCAYDNLVVIPASQAPAALEEYARLQTEREQTELDLPGDTASDVADGEPATVLPRTIAATVRTPARNGKSHHKRNTTRVRQPAPHQPSPTDTQEPLVGHVEFDDFWQKWHDYYNFARAHKGFKGTMCDFVNLSLDAFYEMIGWNLVMYEGEAQVVLRAAA